LSLRRNAAVKYPFCFLISPEYVDPALAEHARTPEKIFASGPHEKDKHGCLTFLSRLSGASEGLEGNLL